MAQHYVAGISSWLCFAETGGFFFQPRSMIWEFTAFSASFALATPAEVPSSHALAVVRTFASMPAITGVANDVPAHSAKPERRSSGSDAVRTSGPRPAA